MIDQYLEENGKIKIWPSKRDKKYAVLAYLSTKFEAEVFYTEKQVNEIIKQWHTFGDFFLLRRELVDKKLIYRTDDGSKYWVEQKL